MIAQLIEFSARHYTLVRITLILSCISIILEFIRIFFWSTPLPARLISVFMNHKNAKVLDLRNQTSFLKAHIPNSQYTPYVGLEHIVQGIQRETPIILITEHGEPSFKVLSFLRKASFTRLYHLEDGIEAWKNAHLPLILQKH